MINRLTPANIRKFEKSETAREVVKIIGNHSKNHWQIFTDNANRPGVLAGMTMRI